MSNSPIPKPPFDAKLWRAASDLSARAFENEVIPVTDLFRASLAGGSQEIVGRSFVNCRLEGPALFLALEGLDFENCHLGDAGGDIRKLLLRPLSDTTVTGAVAFTNCRFKRCAFFAVGFTGPEAFIQQFLAIR